jgi:nucleoside-diphosphate-sugar epimerase
MMDKNRTVLVTGAAGFTGRALALRLIHDGYKVRGSIRPDGNQDTADLIAAGVEIVQADMGNPADCTRITKGCGYIFHIAALFRRADAPDKEYYRINRDATQDLLDAAQKAGVEKVVHCSTIGVCGHIDTPPANEETPYNPGDIYQITKMEGEKIALEVFRSGQIRGTVIRPASIYGPGDLRLLKLFRMIFRGRFLIIGSGKPTFHTVYIDDLVEGFIRGMESKDADGDLFIIAGEKYVPLNELFRIIANALGVKAPWMRIPAWPVQLLGTIVEKICIPLKVSPPIYRRRVDFFTKSRAFDIAKARKILGYVPKVSLEEGIRRTSEWYRNEGLL